MISFAHCHVYNRTEDFNGERHDCKSGKKVASVALLLFLSAFWNCKGKEDETFNFIWPFPFIFVGTEGFQSTIDNSKSVISPAGDRIAFHTNLNGNYEIYSINSDGVNRKDLTENSATDNWPEWSPDGSKIAFLTDRHFANTVEIYLMNSDGLNQQRLTDNGGGILHFRWSTNGSKIVYDLMEMKTYENSIFLINSDGSGKIKLVP